MLKSFEARTVLRIAGCIWIEVFSYVGVDHVVKLTLSRGNNAVHRSVLFCTEAAAIPIAPVDAGILQGKDHAGLAFGRHLKHGSVEFRNVAQALMVTDVVTVHSISRCFVYRLLAVECNRGREGLGESASAETVIVLLVNSRLGLPQRLIDRRREQRLLDSFCRFASAGCGIGSSGGVGRSCGGRRTHGWH